MTITNKQREQVRTRGSVAIPDPYGLLDRYESRLQQLEEALRIAWEFIGADADAQNNPQHRDLGDKASALYRQAIAARRAALSGEPE